MRLSLPRPVLDALRFPLRSLLWLRNNGGDAAEAYVLRALERNARAVNTSTKERP